MQCPLCPKNVQLHTWTVLLTPELKFCLRFPAVKMVYHSFPWWFFLDFQIPVSLSTVGSSYRLMQRMGITGAKSYNQGHDEGIWPNMIACYEPFPKLTKMRPLEKGILLKDDYSVVLCECLNRGGKTHCQALQGFTIHRGTLTEIWPTTLCFLISFSCFMECLLCLPNTTVLIV